MHAKESEKQKTAWAKAEHKLPTDIPTEGDLYRTLETNGFLYELVCPRGGKYTIGAKSLSPHPPQIPKPRLASFPASLRYDAAGGPALGLKVRNVIARAEGPGTMTQKGSRPVRPKLMLGFWA